MQASTRKYRWLPWMVFALAVFIRLWRLLATHLSGDASLVGLNSYHILDGHFPLFFLGQNFMGSIDSYLSAPVFLLFGPSTLTANILPTLLLIGTAGVSYLTLRRLFSLPASLVGFYSLAVPTGLSLFSQTDGKSFYHLALFFGAVLIWLTLALGQSPASRTPLPALAWGLLAGLALYANFLSLVVIVPCLIYLAAVLKKEDAVQRFGMAFGGALAGLLPLLAFTLFRGSPWLGVFPAGPSYTLVDRLALIFFNSLPVALGVHPSDLYGLQLVSVDFLVFALLGLLLLWAGLAMGLQAMRTPRRVYLIPLLILVLNLGAALVGGRPSDYRGHNQRYLLPLYLCLPFFWAYLSERAGRQKMAVIGFLVLWVAVQGGGYLTFAAEIDRGSLMHIPSGDIFTKEKALKERIRNYREAGFHTIYQESEFRLAFLAGGDPIFSGSIDYVDKIASARVGASLNPAFRLPLEANFNLLGVPYRYAYGFYQAFGYPAGVTRLLDRDDWRVVTLNGQRVGKVIQDGDLASGFTTRGNNPDGQGFWIDFGREELIGGLGLVPQHFMEMPGGLKVETAGSDGVFQIIREVRKVSGPFYLSGPNPYYKIRYPRLECYFTPHHARYLRITQLGQIRPDWPVQEVLVFGPTPQAREKSWLEISERIISVLNEHPLKKLYADAWPSCLIFSSNLQKHPRVLLPDKHVNDFGSSDPSPLEPLILDPATGNGLLIFNRESPAVKDRLHRSGIAFNEIQAGSYTLYTLGGRTEGRPISPARIFSDLQPEEAAALAKGLPAGKRWTSGVNQRPGIGLTIDLGRPEAVEWITLKSPQWPRDFPRGLRAHISADGLKWEPAAIELAEPLAFTGQLLFLFRGPVQRYRVRPAPTTRYLRLTLCQSDPAYWWSVEEIRINGPAG